MGKDKEPAASSVDQEPAASSAGTPDDDKKLTFSEIWKEGDEEGDGDWLNGQGLKFHTTADKAFSMDSKKFKETLQSSESGQNREAEAEQARRRGEAKMEEFRRSRKA